VYSQTASQSDLCYGILGGCSLEVKCPTGSVIRGGSVQADAGRLVVTASYASSVLSWKCSVANTDDYNLPSTFYCSAICRAPSPLAQAAAVTGGAQ
jgi:hypothetical protein